ncbi:MAG: HAD family hydrolase [Lachnospiraceae bacterium]|nr:HAD family hydrolase [Lachnospiraceae bacterium]
MDRKPIIFIDGGDTLIEEGSNDRDPLTDIVITAMPIPGALETLRRLKNEGYTVCLIDNVKSESVSNVFGINGHIDCFASISTSEETGASKPSKEIFEDAMTKNSLSDDDKPDIIMIGNSCRDDIAGANRFGITSVLMDWSPRYNMTPQTADQVPDYIIHSPGEIFDLLERIEKRR